jgi:hypothetical protein
MCSTIRAKRFNRPSRLFERTRQRTDRIGELVGNTKLIHLYSETIQKRDVLKVHTSMFGLNKAPEYCIRKIP